MGQNIRLVRLGCYRVASKFRTSMGFSHIEKKYPSLVIFSLFKDKVRDSLLAGQFEGNQEIHINATISGSVNLLSK